MPPPPATFSTIICWPRISESRAARMRATVSEALPAPNGTTSVTKREGQVWAVAVTMPAASARPTETQNPNAKNKTHDILPECFCGLRPRSKLTDSRRVGQGAQSAFTASSTRYGRAHAFCPNRRRGHAASRLCPPYVFYG